MILIVVALLLLGNALVLAIVASNPVYELAPLWMLAGLSAAAGLASLVLTLLRRHRNPLPLDSDAEVDDAPPTPLEEWLPESITRPVYLGRGRRVRYETEIFWLKNALRQVDGYALTLSVSDLEAERRISKTITDITGPALEETK